jgi:hypothetical protein
MRSPSPIPKAFERWRLANEDACALELALLDASLKALSGARPFPTEEERGRAREARALANALFPDAMNSATRVCERAAQTVDRIDRSRPVSRVIPSRDCGAG